MNKILVFLVCTLFAYNLHSQTPLNIPAMIDSPEIELTLQTGETEFTEGVVTATMGANGSLLGPTLILHQGEPVSITVDNQLGEETTVHWHGLHVAPEHDGGPHSVIGIDEQWNPQFTVLDKAGTYWYHPHLHMNTNLHVSQGIAGMILVRDSEEATLGLPMTYGEDEFPLVLQTKDLDEDGQILVGTHGDDLVMVNGTVDGVLDVPAQVVRLRVLNGSSQRFMELGFSNGQTFHVVGTDGGLLQAPVALDRYRIAPGARVDVLVDLSEQEGENFHLMSYASELPNAVYGSSQPGMGAGLTSSLTGYTSNILNGNDYQLLNLNVVGQTMNPITELPTTLAVFEPLQEADADLTRNLTFSMAGAMDLDGPFLINGGSFDMEVIDYEVPLDNVEIWSFTNMTPTAHPFHIHDVQFFILDINGATPPAELQGYNDIIVIPGGMGNARFIAKFEDHANEEVPYMFHCHMLPHEDGGMMGQFIVTEGDGIIEQENFSWSVYPNPSNGAVWFNSQVALNLKVFAADGRLIESFSTGTSGTSELLLPSGIYFVVDQEGNSQKLIIR